jgi:hypothetical protein
MMVAQENQSDGRKSRPKLPQTVKKRRNSCSKRCEKNAVFHFFVAVFRPLGLRVVFHRNSNAALSGRIERTKMGSIGGEMWPYTLMFTFCFLSSSPLLNTICYLNEIITV